MSSSSTLPIEIEEAHGKALAERSTTYVDPETGLTVFSELAHLKRGVCCGNQCRHCPYGWVNVPEKYRLMNHSDRTAHCKSGNPASVKQRQQAIRLQYQEDETTTNRSNNDVTDTEKQQNGNSRHIRPKKTGGRFGGHRTAKNVPYTRGGDKGTAVLLTGERRAKNSVVFEAMGTVDELCAVVGLVHAEVLTMIESESDANRDNGKPKDAQYTAVLSEQLLEIMSRLFDIGSHIAKPRKKIEYDSDDEEEDKEPAFTPDGIGGGFDSDHVQTLEEWIDDHTEDLPELLHFILPTGTKLAALLHQARTVCRRAERQVVPLVHADGSNSNDDNSGVCDPQALAYLNRLSDYFFSAARQANAQAGVGDYAYRRPSRSARQRVLTTTTNGSKG